MGWLWFQIDPLKVGEDIGLWRDSTTGGIVAPVMLYAPKAGKDAK